MFLRKNRAGPHFHFHKRGRGSGPAPYQLQDRKKRFCSTTEKNWKLNCYFSQAQQSLVKPKAFVSRCLVWSTLPERAEMNTGVLHRPAASGSALRAAGNIRHRSAGASRPIGTKILRSHPPQKSVSSQSSPSNVTSVNANFSLSCSHMSTSVPVLFLGVVIIKRS